jgi:hypothetical protein
MAMGEARKQVEDGDEWMSLKEAEKVLDEARATVLGRCVTREIEGKKVAGRFVVRRADVEKVKQQKDAERSPKARR